MTICNHQVDSQFYLWACLLWWLAGKETRMVTQDTVCPYWDWMKSLMAKWLEQASQWHGMYCHNLEVMSSNPGWVELGVLGTSVLSRTWIKMSLNTNSTLCSKDKYTWTWKHENMHCTSVSYQCHVFDFKQWIFVPYVSETQIERCLTEEKPLKSVLLYTICPSWRHSIPSMEHLYGWSFSVFRAKSKNLEKSNTEHELFELNLTMFVTMVSFEPNT